MKGTLISALKVTTFVAVLAAISFSTSAVAKKGGGGGGGGGGGSGCPRAILCPDVWIPVICSDGVVYSNDCYAYQQCATGCVPYGDSESIQSAFRSKCPRPIECPDVYDPVTCSNGITYPNACYAYRACATGCGGSGT